MTYAVTLSCCVCTHLPVAYSNLIFRCPIVGTSANGEPEMHGMLALKFKPAIGAFSGEVWGYKKPDCYKAKSNKKSAIARAFSRGKFPSIQKNQPRRYSNLVFRSLKLRPRTHLKPCISGSFSDNEKSNCYML